MYYANKLDLGIAEQKLENDITPEEFVEELGLVWPQHSGSLAKDPPSKLHDLFTKIVLTALYPDVSIPNFNNANDSDDENETVSTTAKKQLIRPVSVVATLVKTVSIVGVFAFATVMIMKYFRRNK